MHLSLSPNPVNNDLYINFGAVGNGEIVISSSVGNVLQKHKLTVPQQKLHINTKDFPAGMYTVQMVEDGKLVKTESFIKQ